MKIGVQHFALGQWYQRICPVVSGGHNREFVFLKDRPDEGIGNKYAQFTEVTLCQVARRNDASFLGKKTIPRVLYIFTPKCF